MGCFLTASIQTYSQIGIGTTSVESNLLLKVNSTNKGILIPNLTIPNANSPIPVTNPAVGLVAYNNYSGKKGFNYWDGSKWSELVDSKKLSVGNHTIQLAVMNRSGSTPTTMNYGQKAASCTTISNDEAAISAIVLLSQPLQY